MAVVAMLVVEQGSAMTTVEEVATVAAEEADNGWGGRGLRVYSIYFYKPIGASPLTFKGDGIVCR